jgi:enamine deaminase RidA (YjgF/YER057c/UK114 family)
MGQLVFVAGQVAKDRAGAIVGKDDVSAQAEQVYKNLKAVLEAAGSGLDLVGKITVYTTSLEYRPALAAVRDQVFKDIGHFPASTFVVISSLAEPDYLVEIEAVAMIRK